MKVFVLLCLSVALLAGCRKEDVVECYYPVVATVAALRAEAPPVQVYTFNLAQAQSIRTSKGATLAFGPNAFVLPDGSIASGQAVLRVREIYGVPDMILANMPTTSSSGRLLISGGEFSIQVWQGTTRLRLRNQVATASSQGSLLLTSPVPATGLDTTRMMLWNKRFAAGAGTAQDTSGWQQVAGPNGAAAGVFSSGGNFNASLPLDSVSRWGFNQPWRAYQNKALISTQVSVPAGTTATVTHVYFRPVGYNGLGRARATSPALSTWASTLPQGADVVAVVLQERDGSLYYGTQRFTVQASQPVITPALLPLSAAEIVQRIRQL